MNPVLKTVTVPLVIASGLFLGYMGRDFQKGDFTMSALTSALRKQEPTKVDPAELFKGAYQDIETSYYRSLDPIELKYHAMEGAMASLGDPHTVFMNPKFTEDFLKETRGSATYAGIGARLSGDTQGAKLATVFKGSPASAGGLQPGDIIVAVGATKVAGMEIDKIVGLIKGPEGTRVKLTILRPSSGKTLQLEIRRERINIPTADGLILPGTRVAYVMVYGFAETTPKQFRSQIQDLDAQGIDGLIIDLRGNPGGLLDSAAEMLGIFTENKLVVRTVGRDYKEEPVYTPMNERMDLAYPVVVLVNEDSASASEIFAGVLRDYRLATLVGEHTYGKASVQRMFNLPDGAAAKVTIAKYFLPSGHDIMRKVDDEGGYISGGLKPDVEVKLNLGPNTMLGNPERDNQLQKALEVIASKR
ncbi:MAG: S41 family peptidase [Chthonomonas sp.]|nr:S41 family peptidase [Chthonomonas sp.]